MVTVLTNIENLLGDVSTARQHPGQGKTTEVANDLETGASSKALSLEEWVYATVGTARQQGDIDADLSAAPSPADVDAAKELAKQVLVNGGTTADPAVVEWQRMAKERSDAENAHAAATITDWGTCGVPASSSNREIESQQGAAGGAGDTPDGETNGSDDEVPTPVTMSPDADVNTPGAVDRMTPSPAASDTSVGTETSSDTMTADPRTALSGQGTGGQTAGGAGTPSGQGGGAGTPQMGTGVPVSQQLSQNTGGGSGSGSRTPRTKSRSPEAQREERDRQEETDAVHTAGLTATAAGTGAVMGAAATAPTGSPSTTPSNSGTTPPPATPASSSTPPAGTPGMAPLAGKPVMGGGNTVPSMKKPPTTVEADRMLDALIGKPEDKDKKS